MLYPPVNVKGPPRLPADKDVGAASIGVQKARFSQRQDARAGAARRRKRKISPRPDRVLIDAVRIDHPCTQTKIIHRGPLPEVKQG